LSAIQAGILVREIKAHETDVVRKLVGIEKQAFGNGGLHNEWLFLPVLRYGKVLAAETGGEFIGSAQFIRTWTGDGTAYFYGISLLPEYRGRGLGTEFLERSFSILKDEGIIRLILSVSPDNRGAVYLYREKLGFWEKEYVKDEYGPGEDRLIMEREL